MRLATNKLSGRPRLVSLRAPREQLRSHSETCPGRKPRTVGLRDAVGQLGASLHM